MEEVDIPNEEYETQFFGFSPTDAIEGIKQNVLYRFNMSISNLEQHFIKKKVMSEEELGAGISKLKSITNAQVTSVLSKLEKHLMEVFKIPPHILLPEDADHATPISTAQVGSALDENEKQLKKVAQNKLFKALLEDELKRIEKTLDVQNMLLEEIVSKSDEDVAESLSCLHLNAKENRKIYPLQ